MLWMLTCFEAKNLQSKANLYCNVYTWISYIKYDFMNVWESRSQLISYFIRVHILRMKMKYSRPSFASEKRRTPRKYLKWNKEVILNVDKLIRIYIYDVYGRSVCHCRFWNEFIVKIIWYFFYRYSCTQRCFSASAVSTLTVSRFISPICQIPLWSTPGTLQSNFIIVSVDICKFISILPWGG